MAVDGGNRDVHAQATVAPSMVDKWRRICVHLHRTLGDSIFHSWFSPLRLEKLTHDTVFLSCASPFARDWMESHYINHLLDCWQGEVSSISYVELAVRQETSPVGKDASPHKAGGMVKPKDLKDISTSNSFMGRETMDAYLGAPLDDRFTFDTFVVGKSNELAYTAARSITGREQPSFNPLFLYGGVGLGKTHLMHAIAWQIRQQDASKKILYLSAEKFMYRFIQALRDNSTMAFKKNLRNVDVLMVDDIQFIAGKDSTQEEFFHTFNALIDYKHQVIISADRSPTDLDGIEERIRSRLSGGLVADIHPADYELRLCILQTKAEMLARRNTAFSFPADVLEFLAQSIASNVRVLEGALNRVVAYASFVRRPISCDMARDVLQDLLRAHARRITIQDIQKTVADYYNIRMADLLSPRRARVVARPRQIAIYLAKTLTTSSLPEIGRSFGGRDHTTALYAVRKVERLCEDNPSLKGDIRSLQRSLTA